MEHQLEFTLSENPWAPAAVIEEINARTGIGIVLTGLADQTGGISSAAFFCWPDGRQGALTRTDLPESLIHQTSEALDLAREHGIPVPCIDLVLDISDGRTAVLQERMPGGRPARLDNSLVDAMVAMNERFAGLLRDRPDIPPPPAFPTPESLELTWQRTLGAYNDRSRRLLLRLKSCDGGEFHQMDGPDLVHTDYSAENLLFDPTGRITGVVDWNFGAARGDRRYALLNMHAYLAGENSPAAEYADHILIRTIEPDLLRIYRAHRLLHLVHHGIRNRFPADRIEHDMERAEAVTAS